MPTLGGYELTRCLGVGGMGEVWMGQRRAIGGAAKSVAIKVMSRARAGDPNSRKMFLDEARLSMLLANSNIVQVFDVAETEDKTCYMVMEWVDGIDLAVLGDKLRETGDKLPPVVSAYIVGEILKGLAYAHDLDDHGTRRTIVHRDISPHNVMLSTSGEVKIMDFGIARMASEETSGVHVKGKLRYMPPEQLRGESREPTIDLFAVGAILHELLDGTKFRGNVVDEARLYGMILDGEAPALACPEQDVPRELDALRLSLLQAKPEDRVRSARAAYRQLVQWHGYRDARFELEEIVRSHKAAVQQDVDGTAILGGSGTVSDVQPTMVLPSDGSETDTSRASSTGSHTYPAQAAAATGIEARPATAPKTAKLASIALAVVGLAFGVFGAGAMLGWWGGGDEAEGEDAAELAQAEADSTPAEEAEPAVPAEAPEEPAPEEPAPEEPAPEEPEPEAPEPEEPAPEEPTAEELVLEEPEPEPEPGPGPQKAVQKTKVTISAPGYRFWVELKVGGRKFTIDRMKKSSITTRFKPGPYSVSFRDNAKGSWKDAGRIRIPEGGSVKLQLQAGGKVSVK